jgi:hypothetical protein
VPQNLWEAVMGSNPSRWKGPRNSAEMFTIDETEAFCQKATDLMTDAPSPVAASQLKELHVAVAAPEPAKAV